MQLRRFVFVIAVISIAASCSRSAPVGPQAPSNPGAVSPTNVPNRPPPPDAVRDPFTVLPTGSAGAPCAPQGAVPWEVRIDERVSPTIDCNPVRTQHTLVATVYDQNGNPLPGERVEWILPRYPEAVGDIVASDDQYGPGAIAPLTNVHVGNAGNKIDNQYAISFTNFGPEVIDAGNNHPYVGQNGARLPDITVGPGQSWVTITSSREGVTDILVFVPGIKDGTKHKIWAKKVWADFDVRFPESAVNTLPNDRHDFPVTVTTTTGQGLSGQTVDAEILDGPDAVFGGSGAGTETLSTDGRGLASFQLVNRSGRSGVNRIRFTVHGRFHGEVCPRSRIVTKTWRRVDLAVDCRFQGSPGVVGRPVQKVITITNQGDAAAEGVVLDDAPGAGLLVADSARFPMEIGRLAPGQSRSVTVAFTSQAEGRYDNTVRVRDAGSASAESSCQVEFVQGRLEITKVCEPGIVDVGGDVRFVVTIRNSGRGPLENVEIVDEFPDGITPTSKNLATIAQIGPGGRQEVVFTGRAARRGQFTNVARASASGIPEREASCTVQAVECALDMTLLGPDKIYYGEEANFTLQVTNNGDGRAESCTVRVTFGQCLGGGFQDFNIGPLAAGEPWVVDFGKTATETGSCKVTADSNCGARCETTTFVDIDVTGLTALQAEMVDKALDGTEEGVFKIGETFIYTLRVENDVGTERTPPLRIGWELPPELEFVTGRTVNGEVKLSGSGRDAETAEFTLGVGGFLDFEIQVRVIAAPASNLVRTEARVFRVSDGAELAAETESTTLQR